jgi:hypothetical protein
MDGTTGLLRPFEGPYVEGMNLELTDEQTEALIRELSQIIEYDRYRLSPHIRALKEIPRDAPTGARARAAAAATALRAAEQGPVSETRVASAHSRCGLIRLPARVHVCQS